MLFLFLFFIIYFYFYFIIYFLGDSIVYKDSETNEIRFGNFYRFVDINTLEFRNTIDGIDVIDTFRHLASPLSPQMLSLICDESFKHTLVSNPLSDCIDQYYQNFHDLLLPFLYKELKKNSKKSFQIFYLFICFFYFILFVFLLYFILFFIFLFFILIF